MQVLITGGYGFIGSYVAERFFKEDYEIIIIDNLANGEKSNISIPHTAYTFAIEDDKCAEVFRIHNIDIVIHLAYTDINIANHREASMTNIAGLINILSLSKQYKVKKFIFISDVNVYGKQQEIITENTILNPNNHIGINKLTEETYCLNWQKLHRIPVVVLRLSNVYGPRQRKMLLLEMIKKVTAVDLPDSSLPMLDETQILDYIYITDATEAIYKATNAIMPENIINIVQGKEIELANIIPLVQSFMQTNSDVDNFIETDKVSISNSLCCARLDWNPRFTFKEGLKLTYDWYCKIPPKIITPEYSSVWQRFKKYLLPYLENLTLFSILVVITLFWGDRTSINRDIGLDYSFVYIAIMGLLYGKSQALPATALAIALLFYSRISAGADFVALIYQTKPMFHMAIYLLIGVLTGYITDNYQMLIKNMNITIDNLSSRYQFLENLYLETIKIKDKLYNQLINSSDSIGRLYSIMKKLDSIETEYIYTAAVQITAEIMDISSVAIYTLGKNKYYLRQKIKSTPSSDSIAKSLKIENFPYLQTVMQEHKVFVNKNLQAGLPDMAAPVISNNKIIAVLQLYNLPFEKMDLHHETLFKITTKLISDALGRAHIFEESVQDKKYIPNTRILLAEEFAKILEEVEKRSIAQDQITMFKVNQYNTTDMKMISDALDMVIREEDFVGLNFNGDINILLIDIPQEMVSQVQARIENTGIKINLLEVA